MRLLIAYIKRTPIVCVFIYLWIACRIVFINVKVKPLLQSSSYWLQMAPAVLSYRWPPPIHSSILSLSSTSLLLVFHREGLRVERSRSAVLLWLEDCISAQLWLEDWIRAHRVTRTRGTLPHTETQLERKEREKRPRNQEKSPKTSPRKVFRIHALK